jgi:3-phenylpropionate/trans-cinnamate dioxygenase ferredoxin subunit
MRRAIGPVADFEPGRMRMVDVGGRSIGVYNTGSEFFAVLNVCPHQLAPVCRGTVSGTMLPSEPETLHYGLDHRVLRCPWHGWEFDLRTGETLFREDKRRLRTFPVSVEDGIVHLEEKAAPKG